MNAQDFFIAIAPSVYERSAVVEVGRVLERLSLEAMQLLDLGTCIIGPGADQASMKEHLGDRFDEQRDHIICAFAIGYPSAHAPLFMRAMSVWAVTSRRRLEELVFFDHNLQKPVSDVQKHHALRPFLEAFEALRWGPSSFNAQPTRCVVVLNDGMDRVQRLDFVSDSPGRYYNAVAAGAWMANFDKCCDVPGRWTALSVEERGNEDGLHPYNVSFIPEDEETKASVH